MSDPSGIDISTEVIMLHLKSIPVRIYGEFILKKCVVQFSYARVSMVKLTVGYCQPGLLLGNFSKVLYRDLLGTL